VHRADWLAVHPVGGKRIDRETLALGRGSSVTLRLPVERIGIVLPLAGATLELRGATLVLGAPSIRALEPAPSLDARMVIIKLTNVPEKGDGSLDVVALRARFEAEARRQLNALGIGGILAITGRRSITVDRKRVVGFSVRVSELDADGSLRLQVEGIGGKRTMGGGVFRRTRWRVQAAAEPAA
jgi:CRISPR-associated endonuclease/helicase Cas3